MERPPQRSGQYVVGADIAKRCGETLGRPPTDDVEILKERFALYNAMLDAVCNAIKDFKSVPIETSESLCDRLEQFFKERGESDLNPGNFP